MKTINLRAGGLKQDTLFINGHDSPRSITSKEQKKVSATHKNYCQAILCPLLVLCYQLTTTTMSEKTIEDKVRDIIVEQLGVTAEQVTINASFIEDLGADSLDTVELVMAFEEEFGVEVPDEDAEKLQKVGDVVKYIEEKQGK